MKDCKKDYEKFIDETFIKEISKISYEISVYLESRKNKELSPLTMCGISLVASKAYESLKECLDTTPCKAPESVVKMKNILTSIIELIDDFNKQYIAFVGQVYFHHKIKEKSNN